LDEKPVGVTLNKDQVSMLGVVAAMHGQDITLENDGDSSPLVVLHDEDGSVLDQFRLPKVDWKFFKRP
jgi:hypothetical protein